jgi:hypothetical protein
VRVVVADARTSRTRARRVPAGLDPNAVRDLELRPNGSVAWIGPSSAAEGRTARGPCARRERRAHARQRRRRRTAFAGAERRDAVLDQGRAARLGSAEVARYAALTTIPPATVSFDASSIRMKLRTPAAELEVRAAIAGEPR